MLQFIPNAPSTFLWAMNDAHSRMIHSFESILFKGFIKPVLLLLEYSFWVLYPPLCVLHFRSSEAYNTGQCISIYWFADSQFWSLIAVLSQGTVVIQRRLFFRFLFHWRKFCNDIRFEIIWEWYSNVKILQLNLSLKPAKLKSLMMTCVMSFLKQDWQSSFTSTRKH